MLLGRFLEIDRDPCSLQGPVSLVKACERHLHKPFKTPKGNATPNSMPLWLGAGKPTDPLEATRCRATCAERRPLARCQAGHMSKRKNGIGGREVSISVISSTGRCAAKFRCVFPISGEDKWGPSESGRVYIDMVWETNFLFCCGVVLHSSSSLLRSVEIC